MKFSGCNGVMSSEAILEYPALYNGDELVDMDQICGEYLDLVEKYPGEILPKIVKAHLNKFLYSGFTMHGHTDLRDKLNKINGNP